MSTTSWYYLPALTFVLLSAASASAKPAVPPDADVKAATAIIADIYKKDNEAAKTPAQKQQLSQKLLADADKTLDDAPSAYALYLIAQKMAVNIGDVETAMLVNQRLASRFEVDPTALERKLIENLAPLAKLPVDQALLTRYISRLFPPLVGQRKFDEVNALLELALDLARKSKDGDLLKYWTWKQSQLKAQAEAWTKAQAALEKLASSPTDAEAGGTAGAYRAFWEEDWDAAIPLLALSNHSWQPLAERELQGATSPEDKLALADSWFDAGLKAASPAKEAALRHAAAHYERLLPSLTSITKKRVENRLTEIADVACQLPKEVWVETLDFVDVDRYTIRGKWKREGLSLVNRDASEQSRISLPLTLEGSFDIRVRATRVSGSEAVVVFLSRSAHGGGFGLNCYGGKSSGLQCIDGKLIPDNSTRTDGVPLVDGQPFQLSLQIDLKDDKSAVAAFVNNRQYFRWTGTRDRLASDENGLQRDRLIVGTSNSIVAIHSVQIKRKSGPAWILDQAPPGQSKLSPLAAALAAYDRDLAELRTQMLQKFEAALDKTRNDPTIAKADQSKLIARLETERDAYSKAGFLPFSAPMRSAWPACNDQYNAANGRLQKALDAQIGEATKEGRTSEAEDVKKIRDEKLRPRVIARWDDATLYSNGRMIHPSWGDNPWSFQGNLLSVGRDRWTVSHFGDTVDCVNQFNIRFGLTWRPPQ